ncbi:hypothetical protein AGMMS4956_14660 [Bacteroidia bacterium]|nr:hypothetical protein AGMMS4956_14660 [Bacteroidia bacterium]
MIFRFKITSLEQPDFVQEIDIDGNSTWYEFHQFLQQEWDYDNAPIALFHAVDGQWNPQRTFSLLGQNGTELMDEVSVRSLVRAEFHQYLYEFDSFHHRSCRIELRGIEQPDEGVSYPLVYSTKGQIPPQYTGKDATSIFDQAMPDFDVDTYAHTSGDGDE